MTAARTIPTADLPATIREYLAAHVARDADTAVRAFTPDAVVTDDGRTFRGTEEVLRFLRNSGSEFRYSTELVRAEQVDGDRWVVVAHLEGDFPGGVVDLAYRFTTAGDRIAALDIAPWPRAAGVTAR